MSRSAHLPSVGYSGVESEAFLLELLNGFKGCAFMLTVSAGNHGLHTDSFC